MTKRDCFKSEINAHRYEVAVEIRRNGYAPRGQLVKGLVGYVEGRAIREGAREIKSPQ
jgi:hypothetical protein